MERELEPELMIDPHQVEAYSSADFGNGDEQFCNLLRTLIEESQFTLPRMRVIDLGCGPGNICIRLKKFLPFAEIYGIDGSEKMISIAKERAVSQGLTINLFCATLQSALEIQPKEIKGKFDIILSNSLLHHLHDPFVLWRLTSILAASKCIILHKDLRRPESITMARSLVRMHLSENSPKVVSDDFLSSFMASFTKNEVLNQLNSTNLQKLDVKEEDDRYIVISGIIKNVP